MKIETSFRVKAAPDQVYEYLLDVNRVVACVPGAQLAEVVDPDTFRGTVRVSVGPITVSYQGTARITARDPEAHSATLEAEGKETTGSGAAHATTVISVRDEEAWSLVAFATELTVGGRVARFGRGILEDVAQLLVAQVGECIQAKIEGLGLPAEPPASGNTSVASRDLPEASKAAPRDGADSGTQAESRLQPGGHHLRSEIGTGPSPAGAEAVAAPAALDGLALARALAWGRLRPLTRRPGVLALVAASVAFVVGRRVGRGR